MNLRYILSLVSNYSQSSSIFDVKNDSFTFARNDKYLKLLIDETKEVLVLLPSTISTELVEKLPENIEYLILDPEDSVDYIWTYMHNEINRDAPPGEIIIGDDCRIHETAIIGLYGNTYAKAPDGSRLHLKEIGGVMIGDRVDVEAYSLVHRSCFGHTIVEDDVKVCVMCNIGHNTKTGERTYIAPGVKLGGGTEIGRDCFLWQNVVTQSKIKICDRVMIGNNSYVHKDITESGIYVGSPAKYIKPFDKRVLKGEIQW